MNPGYIYQTSASLPPNAPSYVTRQADEQLYQELKAGNCCHVFNSRQMGKSSLRVRVTARLEQEGVEVALIDPQKIGTHLREDQWYAGIIKSLVQEFELEPAFDFRQWWRSHNEPPIPPVQRFDLFVKEVLLRHSDRPVVIFVEEIDRLQSLPFSADDFFLLIRGLYEDRTQNPDLCRLTFALVGVTTPRDLIQDRNHSGFNIGTAVEMEGFTLAEAQPLAAGLVDKVADPQGVLSAVLHWSGGQPFLTQKLLGLVVREVGQGHSPGPDLTTWVGQIAQRRVIDNWEAQDTPEHLRTLQDRMLHVHEQQRGRLLGLYQQILLEDGIAADDSYEQTQLRLTGLVVKRQGRLQVYNPVYEAVFNAPWVAQQLGELRPPFYAQALRAWHDSADSDPSFLLRGQALENAEAWAKGKRLSEEDEVFLRASRQYEKQEMQRKVDAEAKANQILSTARDQVEKELDTANQKLKIIKDKVQCQQAQLSRLQKRALTITIVAALILTATAFAVVLAQRELKETKQAFDKTKEQLQKNEKQLISLAEGLARSSVEIQASSLLIPTLQVGQSIASSGTRNEDLEVSSPIILLLRRRLSEIQERQINARQGTVRSITWIEHDGEIILASGGDDGTMRLWSRTGEPMKNSSDGEPIILLTQQNSPVWSMSWSDEAKMLATGGHDGKLRLWSLKDDGNSMVHVHPEKIIDTGKESRFALSKVQFIKNGTYFLTLSAERRMQLWRADGELINGAELGNQQGGFTSFSWSEASEILATGGADSTFKLWTLDELKSGSMPRSIPTRQDGAIDSISWSQDGELFATAGADGSVRLWTSQGRPLNLSHAEQEAFNPSNPNTINTGQGIVWYLLWIKNNKALVTGGADGSVKFWNLDDPSQPLLKQSIQTLQGSISGMNLTQDEATLATVGTNKTIKLWTLEKEQIFPGDGSIKELEWLMTKGCDWLSSYLISNPEDLKTLLFCQTTELKRSASYNLIADGEQLAREGNLEAAITDFTIAKQWNPSWPEDPKDYAKRIAAEAEN